MGNNDYDNLVGVAPGLAPLNGGAFFSLERWIDAKIWQGEAVTRPRKASVNSAKHLIWCGEPESIAEDYLDLDT